MKPDAQTETNIKCKTGASMNIFARRNVDDHNSLPRPLKSVQKHKHTPEFQRQFLFG